MAACQLFGYESGMLLEQPIEILLPKLYRDFHKQATMKAAESDFRSINVFGLGLHKNGFIIPVNVKSVKSAPIGEDAMLVAAFRVNKGLNRAYVLTDSHYVITNVSANAETMLNIHKETIKKIPTDIRDLCFTIKSTSTEELVGNKIKVDINNIEIGLSTGLIEFKGHKTIGYYFCFSPDYLPTPRKSIKQKLPLEIITPMQKFPQFSFSYDEMSGHFIRNWSKDFKPLAFTKTITYDNSEVFY